MDGVLRVEKTTDLCLQRDLWDLYIYASVEQDCILLLPPSMTHDMTNPEVMSDPLVGVTNALYSSCNPPGVFSQPISSPQHRVGVYTLSLNLFVAP